jgi:hypothetical protein
MKKITSWLVNISVVLVLAGLVGHGVIPHHHHQVEEISHSCCSSEKGTESSEPTCSLFDHIPLDNVKYTNSTIYKNTLSVVTLFITNPISTALFTPWQLSKLLTKFILKKPSPFLKVLSRRGPPVL